MDLILAQLKGKVLEVVLRYQKSMVPSM
jgi:hypothetical protein